MKAAQSKLEVINGTRIISAHSMGEIRARAYRSNRGLTLITRRRCIHFGGSHRFRHGGIDQLLGCQRRRQIGIRSALGATRLAILRLFQKENLSMALGGVLVGSLLAIALNIWLIGRFEMVRLNPAYLIGCGIAMLLLGQIAVCGRPCGHHECHRHWLFAAPK